MVLDHFSHSTMWKHFEVVSDVAPNKKTVKPSQNAKLCYPYLSAPFSQPKGSLFSCKEDPTFKQSSLATVATNCQRSQVVEKWFANDFQKLENWEFGL